MEHWTYALFEVIHGLLEHILIRVLEAEGRDLLTRIAVHDISLVAGSKEARGHDNGMLIGICLPILKDAEVTADGFGLRKGNENLELHIVFLWGEHATRSRSTMTYKIRGRFLEVWSKKILEKCPTGGSIEKVPSSQEPWLDVSWEKLLNPTLIPWGNEEGSTVRELEGKLFSEILSMPEHCFLLGRTVNKTRRILDTPFGK
jgi:hypothetical protein